MLTIIVFLALVPAIYLAVGAPSANRRSFFFGVLVAATVVMPITILTGLVANFAVYGGMIFLLLTALIEEIFRFLGIRLLLVKKESVSNLAFFGYGFGMLELMLRIIGALWGDFSQCNILNSVETCSNDFNNFIIISLQALFLHMFLSVLYLPPKINSKYWHFYVILIVSLTHWSLNSIALDFAVNVQDRHVYLIYFPSISIMYVALIFIAHFRKGISI
jgi:hypothetical protein